MKNKKLLAIIILLIIALIVTTGLIFKNQLLRIIYPKKYIDIIEKYSQEYNIDDCLILAIVKSESNFKSDVESHKGAVGLMQLMENTALEIAPETEEIKEENVRQNLLDSEINIKLGTMYLKTLIDKYNSVELALTAYNAGTGNVDKWIEQGIIQKDGSNIEMVPFKETNKYVRSILRDYKIYKEIY